MSLRALSLWGVLILCIVIAAGASALFLMADTIRGSADIIAFRNEGVFAADALERRLLDYNRVSNLAVAEVDNALTDRAIAREQLEAALQASSRWIASETEEMVLRRTEATVAAYLARRDALEQAQLPIDDILALQRPSLDLALANVRSLRAINHRDLEWAQHAVARDADLQRIVAVVAAVFQVLGLGILAAGLLVYVVRPLAAMQGTLERFSRGDQAARASERGPAELASIARAFNELASVLVLQRQAQLAHLGGVVHDMRDPLLAMSLAVRRLRREPDLPAAAEQSVQALDRQMVRLGRMISDVLEAARIESGMLELRVETVDLRSIVERVVAAFAERAPSYQVLAHLPDESLTVRADPVRIEQVFTNIVANAVKYSPEGSRVEIRVVDDPQGVAVAVTDHGQGIPNEDLERIFRPFRRASGESGVPGVGLGLSVVRRIIDAHGGKLEVHSAVGTGSTFIVHLPRPPEAPAPIAAPLPDPHPA